MTVGVVIVAAGRGERLGGPIPKQLCAIGGRSLLQHSVRAFERHPAVSEMVVVLPAELVSRADELVGPAAIAIRAVAGGARRQDSVRAGAEALSDAVDVVLVHDAARPFVDAGVIGRVLNGVKEGGAAIPAVRARDTVKRRDAATGQIVATLSRDEIWLAQTPQGFRRDVLADAFAEGAEVADATDEAMLAERAGHPVLIVQGDERNVKITTPEDMTAARARFAPAPRVGTGYDLHRLAEGRALVLAGVEIPSDRGPLAHSDGDVVCHALIDAMLGGVGAGDIGRQFPDTDPQWKGAHGLDLLARAVAILGDLGWRVASADVTVVLERPKLASKIDDIRQRLATGLGLDVAQIGLKAKTNEGVDAVGRGEAIVAHAVAVLAEAGS